MTTLKTGDHIASCDRRSHVWTNGELQEGVVSRIWDDESTIDIKVLRHADERMLGCTVPAPAYSINGKPLFRPIRQ